MDSTRLLYTDERWSLDRWQGSSTVCISGLCGLQVKCSIRGRWCGLGRAGCLLLLLDSLVHARCITCACLRRWLLALLEMDAMHQFNRWMVMVAS